MQSIRGQDDCQRIAKGLFVLSQPAARPALHGMDLPQPAKAFPPPLHQKGDFPQLMTSFALAVSFN